MKMRIYIPTKARLDKQTTLNRMPRHLWKYTFLVCPPDEVKPLRERYGDDGVSVVSCKAKGIAATRDWIMQAAKTTGVPRVLMMDDDLTMQRRRKDMRISNVTAEEYRDALEWMDLKLQTYAHASFGARFLAYGATENEMVPGRAMYALGYDVKKFFANKCGFGKDMPAMPTMEDFHVTLQLLRAGLPNCISLVWRVSPYASNAPGGCSTWRNLKNHNASARQLVKLHGDFVALRKADTVWQGQEEPRMEVTVRWQKALKAGVA